MESVKEPLIIYRDILIPLMKTAGFRLEFDASDDKRYHTRFIWKRNYIEKNSMSEFYGQTRAIETKVDVIGIPMGSSFLILHGIIVGALADESDDVKLKIRCLPRTNSLDQSLPDNRFVWNYPKNLSSNLNGSLTQDNINGQSSLSSLRSEDSDQYRKEIALKLESEFVYKLIEMLSLRLSDLPLELKVKILSFLPLNSIVAMSRVSTHWREISLDDQLWKLLVKKFYPDIYCRRVKGQSWKALFKDEFRRQRVLLKRKSFARHHDDFFANRFLALPPSPPLLPITAPPYYPMLPAPPTYIRDLVPYSYFGFNRISF